MNKRPDAVLPLHVWVPPETARFLGFDPDTLPAKRFAGYGLGEPLGIEVQIPRSALYPA